MTSSILAGEKSKWASGRRSSMTVLGKVAVPKPLNLPSQRLENHGLNPNVEIVPKGTLSWGSQSSSSTTNAWGNSPLLTKTDGGASSPSQFSGRPSSGSGTRPSTAGSDKAHETTNAWSQNSRPSSASGALTSNHTALTSLRPRSAETRPGSSQLSRFAGTASDNSAAWGPGNASEKLGVASSRSNGFSLSSGDFPTLGSERDNSGRNADPQEHGSYGRPASSSGRAASEREKGDISVNTNIKSGTVGGWRRDGPQHAEDVPQTTVEKLHGDPPPHLNASVPPQHFDAWHGPPVNAPPGVWYRGPPGGPPPYGTPLAPGGFPIEPFPYFRPQVPPGALANSQPVPPPGIGPRGHHPKTGDLYRPHIPDAYIRPGMPIRPGFYPGPMPYEGYYGPPMGYFNSGERDVPFMGMAGGPSVYNRYAGENAPDPANNHLRASVHGPMGKTPVPEQAETAAPDGNRRPYKVLLKQHNHSDEKLAENKWEDVVPANVPHLEKGDQPRTSLHQSEWGLEESKDEVAYSGSGTFSEDACSRNFANQGTSSDLKDKLTGYRGKGNAVNESSVNRPENIVPTSAGLPQVYPATPKDTTLLQKIEGLNAKARASDERPGAGREEQKDRLQLLDSVVSCSANEMVTGGLCSEKSQVTSHEVDFSAADMSLRPAASGGIAISRRSSPGAQGRFDHHGKRFNTRDGDGWRKKPLATEPVSEVSAANSEPSPSVHVCDHLASVDGGMETAGYNLEGSDDKESLTAVFDANDCEVQRAKKRQMAKQRAEQLQKEEEERTREQKARALAKLEELNQRTQTVDCSYLKLEKALPTDPIQQEQGGSQFLTEPVTLAGKSGAPALVSNSNAQIIESGAKVIGGFTALPNNVPLELSGNVHPEPVVSLGQPSSLPQDTRAAGAANSKAGSQVSEGNVSRHKRMGYKQKQNVPSGKNLTDKPVPVNPAEALKDQNDVAANDIASTEVDNEVVPRSVPSLPVNSNMITESSTHHRRKNNRNNKTKQKLDDGSMETNATKVSTESGKPVSSEFEFDPCAVQSRMTAEHAIQPSGQRTCSPSEETSSRVNNQWKPQQSRRMPRNLVNNRAAERSHVSEAVVWAPVRSQNKAEATNEASDKTSIDNVSLTVKGDSVGQNSMKSKRAEIERYVPKPVAKEMAQQGNVQQQFQSSANQNLSDDTVGRAEPSEHVENLQPSNSAIVNVGFTSDSRNGDNKMNKPLKAHGSWRQRGSVESASVRGLQHGSSSSSNPSKNVQKSTEQSQSSSLDTASLKDQTKSDDWNNSLGWNTLDNSETAAHAATSAAKDQGGTGRGKRHPFRGHRSMGNNNDPDNRIANNESGNQDKYSYQPPASEVGQTDKGFGTKENRGVGERTSHWQPKPQFHSVHNQRGNRPSGGRGATTEVNDAATKDSPSQDGIHRPAQNNKESRENVVQPPTNQPLSKEKSVAEASNLGHHESRRERKAATSRGRPNSPNLTSFNTVEPAPPLPNADTKHERAISAGFHKSGNHSNRSARGGPESRGDWSSGGHDNRQHSTSSNRERQKNSSSHYQPVGQYNNSNKSGNFEGPPADGFHNWGSRYREKNQGHSRHGGAANFYARQNGGSQL